MELAAAGHPAPIVLRTDGHVEQLEIFGTACGMVPGIEYRTISLRLHRGDTMLMFTDGVDEAHGAQGMFGVERLLGLLPAYAGAAPDVVCEAVEQHVVEYADGRPHDEPRLGRAVRLRRVVLEERHAPWSHPVARRAAVDLVGPWHLSNRVDAI